ncbi:phosphatidic acid phosphatase type 2/haloperoxidase [Lasiosphaeria hispida]|uniref:Dolichyldiphosphatase n=1 Tax=Lasiosphaeria hispida TaxID=260671 RepID=A0AAJ0HRT5_9PEZI|nr:phosphatidic acid phosphatase type 2/haloperoxidase [Lasiosphaeria hispida]
MAGDITPLASLSLTHVYYNPDDPISLLCAWLALVPQALCVVYATLIWSTREAEVALMFAGQLACEGANFALKRLIKEERPRHVHQSKSKGYGMPSSHAQFACFWAVALSLFLLVRHRPRHPPAPVPGKDAKGRTPSRLAAIERYAHEPWSLAQRTLVSGGAVTLAGLVGWSRVYLGYHTGKQVLVGCAAGSVSAVAWFAVTYVARETGLLAWALEVPVARWFRLRDLVVEEDLCQAGWEKWEGRREREALVAKQKKRL